MVVQQLQYVIQQLPKCCCNVSKLLLKLQACCNHWATVGQHFGTIGHALPNVAECCRVFFRVLKGCFRTVFQLLAVCYRLKFYQQKTNLSKPVEDRQRGAEILIHSLSLSFKGLDLAGGEASQKTKHPSLMPAYSEVSQFFLIWPFIWPTV